MIEPIKKLTIDQLTICLSTVRLPFLHFEIYLPFDNSISITDCKKWVKRITIPIVDAFNGCRVFESTSLMKVDHIITEEITAIISCHASHIVLLDNISVIKSLIENIDKESLLIVINLKPYLISI